MKFIPSRDESSGVKLMWRDEVNILTKNFDSLLYLYLNRPVYCWTEYNNEIVCKYEGREEGEEEEEKEEGEEEGGEGRGGGDEGGEGEGGEGEGEGEKGEEVKKKKK